MSRPGRSGRTTNVKLPAGPVCELSQVTLDRQPRGARERSRLDCYHLRGLVQRVSEVNACRLAGPMVDDRDRLTQGAVKRVPRRTLAVLDAEIGHRGVRERHRRRRRGTVVAGCRVELRRADGGVVRRAGHSIVRGLHDHDVGLGGSAGVEVRDHAGHLGHAHRARALIDRGRLDRRAGRNDVVQHDIASVAGALVLDRDVIVDRIVAECGGRHCLTLHDVEVRRLGRHRPGCRAHESSRTTAP